MRSQVPTNWHTAQRCMSRTSSLRRDECKVHRLRSLVLLANFMFHEYRRRLRVSTSALVYHNSRIIGLYITKCGMSHVQARMIEFMAKPFGACCTGCTQRWQFLMYPNAARQLNRPVPLRPSSNPLGILPASTQCPTHGSYWVPRNHAPRVEQATPIDTHKSEHTNGVLHLSSTIIYRKTPRTPALHSGWDGTLSR